MSEYLRQADVLALVPVSRTTLWELRRRGEFPEPKRLGGVLLWRRADVEAFLETL